MRETMLMLDLCSGLGGANKEMRDRGWTVYAVDIDDKFSPEIVVDVRDFSWDGDRPDLVWASPPCTEFAKFGMACWYNVDTLPEPDMSIVVACKRIIDECKPRYWIIENVRGAVRFFTPILGRPSKIIFPYYLWGHFPPLGLVDRTEWKAKTKHCSSRASAERSLIPRSLSLAVANAVELQSHLFEVE